MNEVLENHNLHLTITIPTFNRAELIFENLSDLIPKIRKFNISVIVVDNASTDNTKLIVSDFQKVYPYLSYFCQNENVGFDKNVETALRLSKTVYTYILGDGIRICEENIKSILLFLETEKPDLYIVNAKNELNFHDSKYFKTPDKLLHDLGWHMTQVSSIIFSSNIVENANFPKYYDSHFMHFGITFDTIAQLSPFKAYWDSRVFIESSNLKKNNSWYPFRVLEIFGEAWTNVVFSLPETYSMSSKLYCIRNHQKYSNFFKWKTLLKQRAVNGLNYQIFMKYKSYIPIIAPYRIILFFVAAILPNSLNKYYYRYKRTGSV